MVLRRSYPVLAQFEFALGDARVRIPWGGRSPRSLTKVNMALFLRREPQKDDCFFVDANQFDLFRAAIPGRRQYGGAPLLLPL